MIDLLFSFVSKLFAEWRWRRFLRRVEVILPDGSKPALRALLEADEQGEHQARLRRMYGVLTRGGQCSVDFAGDGATVLPLPVMRREGRP